MEANEELRKIMKEREAALTEELSHMYGLALFKDRTLIELKEAVELEGESEESPKMKMLNKAIEYHRLYNRVQVRQNSGLPDEGDNTNI
jgi:inhibitor of KinA sporulation pathway (predicted exonuclease)